MANVTVTPDTVTASGVQPTVQAMAVGDNYIIRNTGRLWIRINKAGAGAANITIVTPKTVNGLAVADRVVNVPSGEDRYIGPFPPDTYNDVSGDIDVSTDEATGCNLEAVQF